MKTVKIFIAVAVMAVISAGVFYACEKKTDPKLNFHKTVSSNLRIFSTMDGLFNEIERVNPMNEVELQNYEDKIGFKSFGKIAESIYFPIVDPIVESEMEFEVDKARDYVLQHSQYLELITDEKGNYEFLPKYDGDFFRYIMNEDRMFQVEGIVYKVFKQAAVGISVAEAAILFDITEENVAEKIDSYPELKILYNNIQVRKGYYGRNITLYSPVASNNIERVKGEFEAQNSRGSSVTSMTTRGWFLVRGQWRGCNNCVFVICKRTLSTDFSMTISGDGVIRSGNHRMTSYGYKIEDVIIPSQAQSYTGPADWFNCFIYALNGSAWIATATLALNYN